MKLVYTSEVVLITVVAFVLILFWLSKSKPYTHQEWEDQCKKDFEKYGPAPEDDN